MKPIPQKWIDARRRYLECHSVVIVANEMGATIALTRKMLRMAYNHVEWCGLRPLK